MSAVVHLRLRRGRVPGRETEKREKMGSERETDGRQIDSDKCGFEKGRKRCGQRG